MTGNVHSLRFRDVQRRFDRAAKSFDEADFVHRSAFDGMIERLSPLVIKPARILDLGSATGSGSRILAKSFRRSRVISLDASPAMLRISKDRRPFLSGIREVQADARQIPLLTGSIDLVFANLLLPWINDLPAFFKEVARILPKGGVFAFSTLGSDSLANLRVAFDSVDPFGHVNDFADMHDVGDALLQTGFADPVLDTDLLTVTFPDTQALYRDLSACGGRNSLTGRRRSLTGKDRFRRAESEFFLAGDDSRLAMKLELVYGHAWGTGPRLPDGEFHFEPAAISHRTRS